MPKSVEGWFGTIGACVGALIAISMAASNGLIFAVFAAVGGVVVGGIVGMLAHWAVFQLPGDVTKFVQSTVKEILGFVKDSWIVLTAIAIGLIIFVGAR